MSLLPLEIVDRSTTDLAQALLAKQHAQLLHLHLHVSNRQRVAVWKASSIMQKATGKYGAFCAQGHRRIGKRCPSLWTDIAAFMRNSNADACSGVKTGPQSQQDCLYAWLIRLARPSNSTTFQGCHWSAENLVPVL